MKTKKKNKKFETIKKERICKNCDGYQVEKNFCKKLNGEIIQTLCCSRFRIKQNLCKNCRNKDICLFEKISTYENEEIIKCDKYQI